MQRIHLASDHAGFDLKATLAQQLTGLGYEVVDDGTHSRESCDYPVFAHKLCEAVEREHCLGILVCGTGIGMSMAANKVDGIRAALCGDVFSAKMSREHNDANVLCLGERVTGPGLAEMMLDVWLDTEFAGGRHERRVHKIMAIEK